MAANSIAGAFTAQEFIDGTEQRALSCIISWGVCRCTCVLAHTLGSLFFYFFIFDSPVFGDVSFPMVMHKMFGLPALIILQNNGMRLAAAARSSDVCHTLSRARCLRNWLLLFPACLNRRGDV